MYVFTRRYIARTPRRVDHRPRSWLVMTSLPVQRIIFSSRIYIHTLTHRKNGASDRVLAIRSIVAIATTIAIQLLICRVAFELERNIARAYTFSRWDIIYISKYIFVVFILSSFELEHSWIEHMSKYLCIIIVD